MHRVSSLDDSPSIHSLFIPSSFLLFVCLHKTLLITIHFSYSFKAVSIRLLIHDRQDLKKKEMAPFYPFLLSITSAIIFLHLISTINPTTLAFLPLLCLLFWFAGSPSVMTLLYPPAHTCFWGGFWYFQINRSGLKGCSTHLSISSTSAAS